MLERQSKSNVNYWDLLRGRIQKGESLLETLRREVMEEIGVNDIGHIQPFITVLTDIRIQNAQEDIGLIFSIYLCDIDHVLSPQLSDEHIDFKWVPVCECLEKLKQYPMQFKDKLSSLF